MRCEDLSRELATPTGDLPPGEMADHLASCPACLERSRNAARLDRIWEATRPPEPSIRELDTLWARASAAFDAPKSKVIPFEKAARPRRRWAAVAFFAAQAATVLVAASFLFRDDTRPASAAPPARLVANVDQTVIVRIDGDGGWVEEILDDSHQYALPSMADATPHDVFNALESMAAQ